MTPEQDPVPWLPPWFEPLEIDATGRRRTREEVGLNDAGRGTLIERMRPFCAQKRGIIEVGSWAGANALKLAHFLPYSTIYCVDTWAGTPVRNGMGDATTTIVQALSKDVVFETFLSNTRDQLFKRIVPCRGTSRQWAENWPFLADAVFIDADHSYEGARDDIHYWWNHTRAGGLLCGHDYQLFPGVKKAVDEFHESAADGYDLVIEGECWFIAEKGKL